MTLKRGANGLIEISESLLVKLAGQAAYERGSAYFDDGRVSSVDSNDRRTVAVVEGSQPYRVELRHTDKVLEGACECPASEGIDFCKHCVAVALVLRGRQAHEHTLKDGDGIDKIAAYLALQPPAALVAELLDVLPRLPELKDKLLLKAEIAGGTVSARSLKKTITQVTRPKPLWEYRHVAAYFARIESAVETIGAVARDLPAELLLELALYGIERVGRALEQVDDSGGYRFATQEALRNLHSEALARVAWSPERKAAHLLDVAAGDPWDQFSGVPGAYAEALGEAGLAAFYSAAETRLNALPPLPNGADFDTKRPYLVLADYLVSRAEADEDWDALIALAFRTATHERDYQRIAELHLRKGDADGAAKWLTHADELSGPDRATSEPLWVEIHAARKDWSAALDTQRRVFESQPSYALYAELLDLAKQAGVADRARSDIQAWLRARHRSTWIDQERAYTLAQILRDEQNWEGVYEALAHRAYDPSYLLDGARWIASSLPGQSCDLYARAIDATIQRKAKRSYETAVAILAESESIFDVVDPNAFSTYVESLRLRHRQKRNFIAALAGLRN
jgi:uncharacterized Zn finger protein